MVSQIVLNSTNWNRLGEQTEIESASQWFCSKFPNLAQIYGAPFLESKTTLDGVSVINPVVPNTDFMAGCLGGRCGKEVVYYGADCMFYYLDLDDIYYPVQETKVGNLMRGWFAKAADELQEKVNVLSLFTTFRSDSVIKSIVERAKSVLLASEDYFSPTSPYQRQSGIELHERLARVFVEKMLISKPSDMVLVAPAYEHYIKLAKERDLVPIKRSVFKEMLKPIIREKFNSGLRCDLVVNGRYQVGWKGVGLNMDAGLN